MPEWLHLEMIAGAAVYSLLGTVLFAVLFLVFEWMTPFSIKHELIEEHNTALAIVIGACALALGLIVATAIGG